MDIQNVLTILGILATLALSIVAVYKAFKTAPKEIKGADVDLSIKYEGLLDKALIRSQKAEAQLEDMENSVRGYEKKIDIYEQMIEELNATVGNHEKEIGELRVKITEQEAKIKEQESEMNALRRKIIRQDDDITTLKEVIAIQDKPIDKTK